MHCPFLPPTARHVTVRRAPAYLDPASELVLALDVMGQTLSTPRMQREPVRA
jgi:hypothetical protein